ncbi:MAG: aldehyde dehydrogenase family protein, partial [Planctomycetota bacterium]
MSDRLGVTKTYKLHIGGGFPRTESGRSISIEQAGEGQVAHVCRASRKDLRNAVEAARGAQPRWADANAYLRGQILYRLAEMMEGKVDELSAAVGVGGDASKSGVSARREVELAIDRVIAFAGWADKYQQVIGSHNPVTGPYYNFSVPEAVGVVGVLAPNEPSL